MADDDVGSAGFVVCQRDSVLQLAFKRDSGAAGSVPGPSEREAEKAISVEIAFCKVAGSDRLDVLSLPALGPFGHVELHRLALLQALEAAALDRREVHKNIFAILTADEAVAFGVIEPLYCSLFCHVDTVPFQIDFYA